MLKNDNLSGRSSLFQKLDRFMTTPGYIMLIMALTALSNLFGLELPVYTAFIVFWAYICIFGKDLLPLIPMLICCYVAPSANNNPGRNTESVFAASGTYFIILGAVLAASLVYRAIRDRKAYKSKKYAFLSGLLVLSATYLLAGIGSSGYKDHALQSILYALMNCVALCGPYLLLSGGIKWDEARKDYLAWTGFGAGFLLLIEIGWIYYSGNVITEGIIERKAIYTGWGMYNNIGATLAMMIPFPFYLATKYRKGWIGACTGSLFLVGVVLTCSRGSILCGGAIWFICIILMLYFAHNRRANIITVACFLVGGLVLLLFFGEKLLNLFSSLLDRGLDPSNRDSIYMDGFRLFAKYPIFGGSFFSTEYTPWGWSTNKAFTGFIPPRWHNTYVQLLASCGVVGFAAYALHRWQTAKFFLRTKSPEKIFIACSIVVLLTTSLFDCHFFNIGPALFYSAALAFAENCQEN